MPGVKFRRRTKIDVLPAEIRRQVDRLLIEGMTYSELAAWLREQGHDISQSAVGRYGADFFELYRSVRRYEDQAEALKGEAGDGLGMEEAAGKLLMHRLLKLIAEDPDDTVELMRIVSGFAQLQNSNVRREQVKAAWAEKAAAKLDEMEKEAEATGLDAETLRRVREEIYGL